MYSLWDSMRFRLKPHACDRDYQHISETRGCAPSFSLNSAKRDALGYVSLETKGRMYPYRMKNTYAQTIDRRHYTVVGMGRPPFDISNTQDFSNKYRKFGFLSPPANVDSVYSSSTDKSIFASCRTLEQCFKDDFHYNGKIVERRIFTNLNEMRDWVPREGERCGIFGKEVDPTTITASCPGINPLTHSCCEIDMAVVPLYYLFKTKRSETLDQLDNICNKGSLPFLNGPVKEQGIFSIEAVTAAVGSIQMVYPVPRNDKAARNAQLTDIRDKLNIILDEFVPDFAVENAFQYMQVVDCSLALYNMIQEHTTCPLQEGEEAEVKLDKSPFCPSYAVSQHRSGLYFFLDYTMTEFPFAWWHKCMLLKGRTFSSQMSVLTLQGSASYGLIECKEWRMDSIVEKKMNLTSANYAGSDARAKLLSADGGITSAMVAERIEVLKDSMSKFAKAFIAGGNSFYEAPAQEEEELSLAIESAAHKGVPESFNLKCYKMVRFPPDQDRFKNQQYPKQDCMQEYLWWVNNELANIGEWPMHFKLSEFFRNPNSSCFYLDEDDLDPFTGSSAATGPFTLVKDLALTPETGAVLLNSLKPNNFFQRSTNDPVKGLLLTELSPNEPPEVEDFLPEEMDEFHNVLDPFTRKDEFENFYAKLHSAEYPCVQVEDVQPRLPACDEFTLEPVDLTNDHCWKMLTDARLQIADYAVEISKYPSSFPQRSVHIVEDRNDLVSIGKTKYCVWDCGNDYALNEKVHIGLSEPNKQYLEDKAKKLFDSCMEYVKLGDHVYVPPDFRKSKDETSKIAVETFSEKRKGITTQQVCGYSHKFCQYLLVVADCTPEYYSQPMSDPSRKFDGPARIFDQQDEKKYSKEYYCYTSSVRSTGSSAVDKVRAGLSFNDIKIALDEDLFKAQDYKKRTAFLDRVFNLLTVDVWEGMRRRTTEVRRWVKGEFCFI